MKIIFYGNRKGNIFDKLIRWWTSPLPEMFNGKWKDSYSHVELLFSDGMMFSASQYENSTRFRKHNLESSSWEYVDTDLSADDEAKIRKYCNSVNGKKYDYLGILGFILFTPDSPNKWFCSEVCTKGLQQVGLCAELKSSRTSPNCLYRELKDK